jgi:NAD(P)-dependent dehydrogenase (short-subunit alcohol dehydrogenase family)
MSSFDLTGKTAVVTGGAGVLCSTMVRGLVENGVRVAILDLKAANGWDHLDLTCLPAKLHLWPDRITAAVEAAVQAHRASYAAVFVVYADCGTGGKLFEKCKELGVEMLEGPHCYSFYEGNAAFAAKAEEEFTAFYLTDFLVRQFDAFVWIPMGLDRHPELRDMYFGHYTKLVYQAQTDDPALDARARDCAARLGLAYERRLTGYGDLRAALARL